MVLLGTGGRRTGGGDGNVNLEIHFTSALFLSLDPPEQMN